MGMTESKPEAGSIYRDFKGRIYQVISTATQVETNEAVVVYQALFGDYAIYVQRTENFFADVNKSKYPDCTQKKCFVRVNKDSLAAIEQSTAQAQQQSTHASPASSIQNTDTACAAQASQTESAASAVQASKTEGTACAVQASKTESSAPTVQAPTSDYAPAYNAKDVNPDLLRFLDANTSADKLKVLSEIYEKVDDRMLNSMEASMDIVSESRRSEERLDYIVAQLRARNRYENNRLR